MRKLLNFVIFLLILVDVFLCLYKIPPIDCFISEKILNSSENTENVSSILHSDRNESVKNRPEISVADNTIYMKYNGETVNILPEGFTVDSENPEKVYEVLLSDGNMSFSDDGKKVAFVVTFNKTYNLFLCNLEEKTSVKIDEKIDSFVMSCDGSCVFYATGYLYSNSLFMFKEGVSVHVGENVSALYMSRYNSVAVKAQDGTLGIFNASDPVMKRVDTGVDKIFYPGEDNSYNYTLSYDTLSVFYEKNGVLNLFSADCDENGVAEKGIISTYSVSFEEIAPYFSFTSQYGTYKFYKNRNLFVENGANGEEILLEKVTYVYLFDGTTKFVLAKDNNLILFDAADGSSVTLMDLGRKYEGTDEMAEKKITVSSKDFREFFVCSLNDSSWIWNRYNLNSWINKISKFSYSLTKITVDNGNVSSSLQDLPAASEIYGAYFMNNDLYFMLRAENDGSILTFCYDGTGFSKKNQ